MAAFMYGQAMVCSPSDSIMRFKFGEALLKMGFIDGKENVREAWILEPNNPVFNSEMNRLTALQ